MLAALIPGLGLARNASALRLLSGTDRAVTWTDAAPASFPWVVQQEPQDRGVGWPGTVVLV